MQKKVSFKHSKFKKKKSVINRNAVDIALPTALRYRPSFMTDYQKFKNEESLLLNSLLGAGCMSDSEHHKHLYDNGQSKVIANSLIKQMNKRKNADALFNYMYHKNLKLRNYAYYYFQKN